MMNEKQIQDAQDAVVKAVAEVCFTKVEAATPLISSGLLDSIGRIHLTVALEEKFNVKISNGEVNSETFENVASIVRLIAAKV